MALTDTPMRNVFNRRIRKSVSQNQSQNSTPRVTRYGWDGEQMCAEVKDGLTRTTIYEPGSHVPLLRIDQEEQSPEPVPNLDLAPGVQRLFAPPRPKPPARIAHYHTDHLGTPLMLTGPEGKELWWASPDDWSAVRDEKGETDQPIRFQGQQLDEESGLHYNWHRYYDPSIGRYVTQDPVGLEGGANTYAYVEGNPLSGIDPMGLATRAEINAALQTLRTSYPSDFTKAPASVTPVPMGENGLGMTDWGNNVSLNSDRFGSGTDCVKSGDEYQFLQTLAHEMLHVNESIPRRLLSNSFRMGNPLGYYHRQLDDKADEMITQKTIDKYIKARSSNKGCTCR